MFIIFHYLLLIFQFIFLDISSYFLHFSFFVHFLHFSNVFLLSFFFFFSWFLEITCLVLTALYFKMFLVSDISLDTTSFFPAYTCSHTLTREHDPHHYDLGFFFFFFFFLFSFSFFSSFFFLLFLFLFLSSFFFFFSRKKFSFFFFLFSCFFF